MDPDQYIQQQIKTIFKVSKRLQHAFSDVKKLTTKYLLKVKKIKDKRAQAIIQREQLKKKEEQDRRKRQKLEKKKARKQKQRQQIKMNAQANDKNKGDEQKKPQPKSIISILRDQRLSKSDSKRKQKRQQKQQKDNQKSKSKESKSKPQVQKQKQKQVQKQRIQRPLQKPVQPETPYFRFLRMKKNQIKSSITNMPAQQTTKIMRNVWDKMSDEQKRPYVVQYERQKAKYQRQIFLYFNPRRGQSRRVQDKKQQKVVDYDFIDQLSRM